MSIDHGDIGLKGNLGLTITRGNPSSNGDKRDRDKDKEIESRAIFDKAHEAHLARLGELDDLLKARKKRAKEIRREVFKWHLKNWLTYRWKEIPFYLFLFVLLPVLKYFIPAISVMHSKLSIRRTRHNWQTGEDEIVDYGCIGRHLVVTAGKNYVAACFDNTNEPENLKFHAFGLGVSGPSAGDTLMGNECTTEYATDNVRPTGTQAHGTPTYTTVGTFAPDSAGSATIPVTEWGLFSVATVNTITLFDRQVFAAINLAPAADTLATTYVLTLS